LANEGMQPAHADPGPPFVVVVVVIADVEEKVPVIEDADPRQFAIDLGHEPLLPDCRLTTGSTVSFILDLLEVLVINYSFSSQVSGGEKHLLILRRNILPGGIVGRLQRDLN